MYEKFAELIEKRGVTTYQVSKATGIPTATFSAWKQGKYNPKPDKIQKIAAFLNVDTSYFYGDGSKENAPTSAYNADLMELMHEARKARTSDLRAVLEHLKRLNQYAEMLDQLEKGKEE